MSAKFLNAFNDENPELQRQIGCMTGLFHMFDQRHLLAGRRLNGHNHKKIVSGHARSNSSSHIARHYGCPPQIVMEKNISKSINENQRVSVESSRTSFSSSSCSSSFSSLDCNRSTQREPPSFERTVFPEKSFQTAQKPKSLEIDTKTALRGTSIELPPASAQTTQQSLNFRDFVKDSINREARSLSVKTSTKEGVKNHILKPRDSPRPMQLSKIVDGSFAIGIGGKSRMPVENLNAAVRVLEKLKEAPRHFAETKEPPRSSYERQDDSYTPTTDTPRFSYDGRDLPPRSSLDSRENSKFASRLRELPRLSLDSRGGSMANSNLVSKLNTILKDTDSTVSQKLSTAVNLQQDSLSQKRPSSVVAKLMGLEGLPSMSKDTPESTGLPMTPNSKGCDLFGAPKSSSFLQKIQDNKQERPLQSPNRSIKDSVTPRLRNADPVMKPMSNAKVPIETAPWKQQEKVRVPRKAACGYQEAQTKQPTETVYSEIENRLKELEFQQSNKDLRALKQILEAMQAKGLLQTKKGKEQQTKVAAQKNYNNETPANSSSLAKSSTALRSFQSPIVIMKPAKSITRSGILTSSAVSLEVLSGLPKLRTGDSIDKMKGSVTARTGKKSNNMSEENTLQKARPRTPQSSSGRQLSQRENGSPMKSSNSISPRLQQRKAEAEKRMHPPTFPSDSNKPHSAYKQQQQLESVSPGGRLRRKPTQVQQNDDQLSEVSSNTRSLSYQCDEISQRSDSNVSLASQVDVEVTSADRSAEMDRTSYQQGCRSPSRKAGNNAASVLKQKKSSFGSKDDASTRELAGTAPEQPSPISVLDASIYQDDMPPSPVKKISRVLKDNKNGSTISEISSPTLCSEINHKKLESIESLVQKLRELTSTDDETQTTDHIASLCETQNPDHRYVSEILLASGLLMKDLNSGPMDSRPTQPHPSGNPINPDLFLVLEQTKSSLLPKVRVHQEEDIRRKTDPEKLHRKLIFNVVNELLVQKLELMSGSSLPSILLQPRRLSKRIPTGQRLLKELCSDIDQLQAAGLISSDSDDSNLVSSDEMLRRSQPWEDFGKEISALVLEIERSIFKDLIDEVVCCEATIVLHAQTNRRRRQLFAK